MKNTTAHITAIVCFIVKKKTFVLPWILRVDPKRQNAQRVLGWIGYVLEPVPGAGGLLIQAVTDGCAIER